MFRKILVFMLVGTFILIVSGCKNKEVETDKIPSEGVYVRSVEVEERIPHNVADDTVLEYYDEDILFEDSDFIFKGKVLDGKEIAIEEYIDGELNYTYYEDNFTFEIEKIYYSEDSSLEIGDVIKISNGSCTNDWIEGTLKMEKDNEYIVLTMKTHDTPTIEFTNYSDYFTADHYVSIIGIENGDYFVDEILTSLISGAKEEILREDGNFRTTVYVKGEGFEEEFENLITQKKG